MNTCLSIIESGDLCSLGFVILLLIAIGTRMVSRAPQLQVWGWRLSAGAFVAYAACGIALAQGADAASLAKILIRAVLAAGLVLGMAWVLLPLAAFLWRTWLQAFAKCRSLLRALRASRSDEETELDRMRAALAAKDAELSSQKKLRQRANEVAQADHEAQRRRVNARASCELLFAQYGAELEQRFPKAVFDRFVENYMSDECPAEEVERRAEQLRGVLLEQRQILDPARRFSTLAELTTWYRDQQLQIRNAGIDPQSAEVLLVNLEIQYEELLRRFIQEA